MTEDLRQNPNWRKLAPYGLHVDGTPMSKEEYQALNGQKTLHVSVDTSTIEKLAKEREIVQEKEQELDEKLEKVEGTEQVFEQLKSAVEEKYSKEHLAVPKIENLDDLNNASQNLSEIKRRTQPKSGLNQGGTASLEGQYQSGKQGFETVEEMVLNLRDRASFQNPDKNDQKLAQTQLSELMAKVLRGQKQHGSLPLSYSGKNVIQHRKDMFERRKKLQYSQKGET